VVTALGPRLLAELRAVARQGLADYFAGKPAFRYALPISGHVVRQPAGPGPHEPPRHVAAMQTQDLPQAFAWRAAQAIAGVGRRLRQCANPNCNKGEPKPFVATRRQAFCSRLCSDRVRLARFRAKHAKDAKRRAKLLAKRRAAYGRKVKAALGPKVKIRQRAKGVQ